MRRALSLLLVVALLATPGALADDGPGCPDLLRQLEEGALVLADVVSCIPVTLEPGLDDVCAAMGQSCCDVLDVNCIFEASAALARRIGNELVVAFCISVTDTLEDAQHLQVDVGRPCGSTGGA